MPAQIPFDLPARTSLARDDLVASEANALAIGAIDTWPDWPHPVLVVVGPEGGLAAEELTALESAGARPVRMGAEVLRTSTAGVAACAALLSRTPRWS